MVYAQIEKGAYSCEDDIDIVITNKTIEFDEEVFELKSVNWKNLDGDETKYKILNYSNQITIFVENILEDDEQKQYSMLAVVFTKNVDRYSLTMTGFNLAENQKTLKSSPVKNGKRTYLCEKK